MPDRPIPAAVPYRANLKGIDLDLTHSHVWDHSAIAAIDKVVINFRKQGTGVRLIGMNEASATLVERLAMHDKPGVREKEASH